MQLFKEFGFEPTFFFAQIINFLIIAAIFKRFLYKPVLKTINDRKRAIEKGLSDAAKAAEDLERAEIRREEIIKEATVYSEKIIEDTKKAASELKEKLETAAHKDAEKIITDAKEQAEIEFKKASENAGNLALEISKKIVNKLISELFTKEEKAKIMARNVKRLENLS